MSNIAVITSKELKKELGKYDKNSNESFDRKYLKELENTHKVVIIGFNVSKEKFNFIVYHNGAGKDCYTTSTISVEDFRDNKHGSSTTVSKLANEAYSMIVERAKLKGNSEEDLRKMGKQNLEIRAIKNMPTFNDIYTQWGCIKKYINLN